MEKDVSQIEGMLRRNERDIEAIDDEIKGLEGAIVGMEGQIVSLTKQKEICLHLDLSLKVLVNGFASKVGLCVDLWGKRRFCPISPILTVRSPRHKAGKFLKYPAIFSRLHNVLGES